jgi:hypothetical protein
MTMSRSSEAYADFERYPPGESRDETDVSLRAYVCRIPESKLAAYQPGWSDDLVMDWDGNFRSDGCLMLVCCERDVDVAEFRRVLEEFLAWRGKHSGEA